MKYALFILLSMTAFSSWGMKVSDDRAAAFVELPKAWTYEKNLMGLPHVFLGPEGKERVSVSLTITGISDVKLPVKDLKKNQDQYQHGRKEWAHERGFTILNFAPYSEKKTTDGFRIHEIGFEYKDASTTYSEFSYYVECPESLLHLKILGPKSSVQQTEAKKLISSLACRS